ncbi:MAG: peptidase A24 [Euryarchaeota archaeon]|nr:peptidase A24 [Euryarchaeota archaeon]
MHTLDLLRFVVALPFFIYASYSDLKERLISTWVWFILGIFAVAFLVIQFPTLHGIIAIIPLVIIFYEWFFEWEHRWVPYVFYGIAGAIFLYSLTFVHEVYPLSIAFLMLLFVKLMHHLKIIRGRADARALMTVAILQPLYPSFLSFPIFTPQYVEIVEITFPFMFLVLLYAAITSLFYLLGILFRNLSRGDTGFPEMFIGYRIPIDEVDKKHVWLMERVVDGEHVLYVHPREHKKEDLEALKKIGRDRVWVQPKIPFIVFITAGLIMAYLIGNFV